MPIKLKLKISILDEQEMDMYGDLYNEYHLKITYLEKDERFEADDVTKELNFTSDGFSINTRKEDSYGFLPNGIYIPSSGIVYNGSLNFLKQINN
jgi:hypothetical protein